MRRKKIVLSMIFSFVVLNVFGETILFAKEGEPLSQTHATTSGVEIGLRVVHMLPDRWEFELRAHNSRSDAVFIMTAPVRSNGSRGSYFALDQQDPSVLNVSIHLYASPSYSIYSNQTRVTLERLDPCATHIEQIILEFPAKETSPPYKGLEYEMLDKSRIRAVRVAIGILPDDEGIRDFLRRKQGIGRYAGGNELVQKGRLAGKSLYEVQEIVRTSTLKL